MTGTQDIIKCPICDYQSISFYNQSYDDRYGYPGCFDLYKCTNCRHIFLNSRFSDDEITDLYTNYYPRSDFNVNNIVQSRELKGLSSWLKGYQSSAYTYVPRNVKILDIGCGFGETLAYHQGRGCDPYGSEVDKNVACVAEKFGFNIRIGPYDPKNYEKNFFDYITLDQVIEHVSDPIELLMGIHENLKEGGIAIISCPNVHGWGAKWYKERWLHWHVPYHLHFFSKKSMNLAAKKANLQMKSVNSATLSDWLFWQWIHVIFIPEINKPSLFWKYLYKNRYSDEQLKKLKKLEKFRKFRINEIITRFFDILNLGDNNVFILMKPHNF